MWPWFQRSPLHMVGKLIIELRSVIVQEEPKWLPTSKETLVVNKVLQNCQVFACSPSDL